MSTVTVSIPTLNRPELLSEAIASVLTQTFTDFTILVCDNASSIDLRPVVQGFNDSRIRLHRHTENIGLQHNWRFAIESPDTELVALLMDDDLFLPHHLQNGIDALESFRSATYYGCASETFGSERDAIQVPYWLADATAPSFTNAATYPFAVLRGNPVTSASLIIRRSAVSNITHWGGKRWPGVMDRLWTGQLFLHGGLAYDPTIGVRYRSHPGMDTFNWKRSGMVAVDERYTLQVLAHLGYERGLFRPEELVAEVIKWPIPDASRVVLSLASRDCSPALRRAAYAIYETHPTLKSSHCSKHLTLARLMGSLYLGFADKLDRLRLGWPPSDR